jgi:hypothetical protein
MNLTLTQNGVEDDSEKYSNTDMHEDCFTTTLHIYFNDDLTYA